MKIESKEEFINQIKDGKWLKSKYYLIKFKYVDKHLAGLWLSVRDPEGMCYSEQSDKDWIIDNGKFTEYSAGVYNFGGAYGDDSIYDEETGEIIIDKLKDVVLNSYENKHYNMLDSDEFDFIWGKLKDNDLVCFDTLPINT